MNGMLSLKSVAVHHPERYSPTEYRRRTNIQVPVVHSEPLDGFRVIEAVSGNPTAELRAAILNLDTPEPVVVKRRYEETSPEALAVKAAADLGVLLLDGLADGIWIDAPGFAEDQVREIELSQVESSQSKSTGTSSSRKRLHKAGGYLSEVICSFFQVPSE